MDGEHTLARCGEITKKKVLRTVFAQLYTQRVKLEGMMLKPNMVMNARWKSRLPWTLTFSFARAIQEPALDIWHGQESNVVAAQRALSHRARCNRVARRGEYSAAAVESASV